MHLILSSPTVFSSSYYRQTWIGLQPWYCRHVTALKQFLHVLSILLHIRHYTFKVAQLYVCYMICMLPPPPPPPKFLLYVTFKTTLNPCTKTFLLVATCFDLDLFYTADVSEKVLMGKYIWRLNSLWCAPPIWFFKSLQKRKTFYWQAQPIISLKLLRSMGNFEVPQIFFLQSCSVKVKNSSLIQPLPPLYNQECTFTCSR